jgi:hypothetical protein
LGRRNRYNSRRHKEGALQIKKHACERVHEFLSLSVNWSMAITNIPKLIINDNTSKVSIYTSPPYLQPSRKQTCPILKLSAYLKIRSKGLKKTSYMVKLHAAGFFSFFYGNIAAGIDFCADSVKFCAHSVKFCAHSQISVRIKEYMCVQQLDRSFLSECSRNPDLFTS